MKIIFTSGYVIQNKTKNYIFAIRWSKTYTASTQWNWLAINDL